MGTRGAYGFVVDGTTKATYNHFDSYPSALGNNVIQALRGRTLEDIRRIAEAVELVIEDKKPTRGQIQRCIHLYDSKVSSGRTDEWYCLLRNAQGEIGRLLDGEIPFMIDSANFLCDSLFCEWAYLINLDTRMLEVYRGFCKDPRQPSRYHPKEANNGYWGVALLCEIPLSQIADMTECTATRLMEDIETQVYEADDSE